MGYEFFKYLKHIDDKTVDLKLSDGTRLFRFYYLAGSPTKSRMRGGDTAGDDFQFGANSVDALPIIDLNGNGSIDIQYPTAQTVKFYAGTTEMITIGNDGYIGMLETATPSAVANYGAIYCKADNKLYFQDGAGAEHEVAFV